ncbi:MAG: hypothetical protein IJP11_05765 [Oscillospiraceae bacterium]|nr:hypothetical protein [Oscillospiraceae bacterium]
MKKYYAFFLGVVFLCLLSFGLYSFVDKDDDISQAENRGLAQKPEFTLAKFFDGTYMQELDTYYTDQFPLRDRLMPMNASMNKFYLFSPGGSSGNATIIIETTGNAGQGGMGGLGQDTQQPSPDPDDPSSDPGVTMQDPEIQDPGQTGTTTEPTPEPEKDPEFENPTDAQTVNSMLVSGDRAMEIVYRNDDVMALYAEAVNELAKVVGPGVNTYSLLTPNSTQFYGPADIREGGSTNQCTMITDVYKMMDSSVTTVDAYAKLVKHMDEYIYFRTDHHWTQRGAYYAYTAFCEAADLDPVPLDQFETGYASHTDTGATTFLGTLYNNVAGSSAQAAAAMEANPDQLEYFMPVVGTDATAYTSLEAGGVLYGAYNGVTTVAKQSWDKYLYMVFIGGDQPIEIIETDVGNDKVVIVLKESYGNSFVPFLTSHYSKVVIVDPRKFNTSSSPKLYLPDLIAVTGCDDLIVINYPFMPVNKYYCNRLRTLAGLTALG